MGTRKIMDMAAQPLAYLGMGIPSGACRAPRPPELNSALPVAHWHLGCTESRAGFRGGVGGKLRAARQRRRCATFNPPSTIAPGLERPCGACQCGARARTLAVRAQFGFEGRGAPRDAGTTTFCGLRWGCQRVRRSWMRGGVWLWGLRDVVGHRCNDQSGLALRDQRHSWVLLLLLSTPPR